MSRLNLETDEQFDKTLNDLSKITGGTKAEVIRYLHYLPPMPVEAGRSPEEILSALDAHKLILDQYRENASFAFDLVVTKTLLPLVTLLLGYLFGKL